MLSLQRKNEEIKATMTGKKWRIQKRILGKAMHFEKESVREYNKTY